MSRLERGVALERRGGGGRLDLDGLAPATPAPAGQVRPSRPDPAVPAGPAGTAGSAVSPGAKEAGASGSKLAGGGYSRPPPRARMSPISASRSLVGSMAIRMTGLAPSPRRSL